MRVEVPTGVNCAARKVYVCESENAVAPMARCLSLNVAVSFVLKNPPPAMTLGAGLANTAAGRPCDAVPLGVLAEK
jgi:hypothetical protein